MVRKNRTHPEADQVLKKKGLQAKGWKTTDEDEVERRRRRAEVEPISVKPLDSRLNLFGTFIATTGDSGRPHRIEVRSIGQRENSCDCPDFRINGLGTCKHVEAVLRFLRLNMPDRYDRAKHLSSPRIEIYLDRKRASAITVAWPRGAASAPRRLVEPFFGADCRLLADPLDAIPALRRTLAAALPRVRNQVRIAGDVDDWMEELRRRQSRLGAKDAFLKDVRAGKRSMDVLRMKLYPYQQEGMLHLAFGERAMLADDMGLGKTPQAIAAAELLRRVRGIERVLIVSPVSLKAEWEEQIAKFSGLPTRMIWGPRPARLKQYRNPAFFNLANYEQVRNDLDDINNLLAPDLVILDEAQRIKNWQTKTAGQLKRLASPYAFVLTGTPLENRIDELYSIVDFLDQHLLGPLFRFNRRFYQLDDRGKPAGFKNLRELNRTVRSIMLRRRKEDVEDQLPGRTVNTYFVPMAKEQKLRYAEYENKVARLMQILKKRPLKKEEMDRLQQCLACMRMLCDTTYILDQSTRVCPKLPELGAILDNIFSANGSKVVIFSEWERMLKLVRELLEEMNIGYSWHTGSVPQVKRREEINKFKEDPARRVFLSTDAGATGLNLQAANIVVNCDLPWNPAKLEQRIARCWRKFQEKPVSVINLVCENSIEHRMLGTLKAKQQLADGVLDGIGDLDSIDMPSGRAAFMERLESVIGVDFTRTPRPAPTPAAPAPPPAVSPMELFRQDLIARLADRLLLLERRRAPDGRDMILAVVDGSADEVSPLAHRLLEQSFPKSRDLPGLEVMDRNTYETLQRLASSGLISIEAGHGSTLHASPAFGGAEEEEKDDSAARLAEAKKKFGLVARKHRMSKVLAEGGFPIEALAPLAQAFESALSAALHAVVGDPNGSGQVPEAAINEHLVPSGIAPKDAATVTTELRQAAEDPDDLDEDSAGQIVTSALAIIDHIGSYLEGREMHS